MKKIALLFALAYSTLSFAQGVQTEGLPPGIRVGKVAPEFEAKRLDGQVVSLKKLKGNLVLLDFWASWCGPCRQENPNLVKIYDEFKDAKFSNGKRFVIVSVSLDRQENPWISAIQNDKLVWDNHIWDQKGEIAGKYFVQFIPSAFLIDKKGNVVATIEELRGANLRTVLMKYKK